MSRRLLLVDDNATTRKMVRFALERRGYEVHEAGDAADAIEHVRAAPPDLILLDLMLGAGSGFEVARTLRDSGFAKPILALSGFVSRLDEARVPTSGFDDVILKPIEPSRLLEIVEAHLAMSASSDEASASAEDISLILVDDDPAQRRLAAMRLSRLGFHVQTASTGVEALARARASRPDIIVSDVMMPELDGLGLCRALKGDELLRDVSVVLVTSGDIEPADYDLARRLGADAYVLRTPSLDAVVDAVSRVLRKEQSAPPAPPEPPGDPSIERARVQRLSRQLETQVGLNADLARRSATLTAELTMLHRISDALTHDTHLDSDLSSVLDTVLAACFDAGGISHGTLYLIEPDGELEVRAFGNAGPTESGAEFSTRAELEAVAREAKVRGARFEAPALARRALVPLTRGDELLGALLLVSSTSCFEGDRLAFAEGVANQLALAISLTRTFAARAASEREAREQFAILRSMFDGISDALVVVDRAGAFKHWNTAASDQFKFAPRAERPNEWPAAYGFHRPDGRLFDWHDLPLVRAMRGAKVDREEVYRPNHKAEGAWIAVTARPLFDDHGEPAGAVGVFRDVTHEHESRAQELASERMASVGLIAAGVAHEINNPLAAASANAEYALSVLNDAPSAGELDLDEVRLVLGDSMEALRRVRDIVKDLRVFSHVEAERREPIDLVPVLRSSVRMARNELRHRARVEELLEPVAAVVGNEARLGQVLLNRLVNAAHAIPEGYVHANKVTLRTAMRGEGHVVVSIEDTGAGMSEVTKKRLFSPFFTTKAAGTGTGLGLSICKRIVSDFGGHIEVESEVGRGSTFRVVLPAVSTGAAATGARELSAEVASSVGARILVLDDDALVARTVKRALATHDVFAERSGVAALARLEAGEEFDLIICDLMMPAMSGEQFYRRLGEHDPALLDRVLFVSGGAFSVAAREFLESVPNLRLEKPFALAALRETVERALRRARRAAPDAPRGGA